MIKVKAPGKIMIVGEWSVLEFGNSCIVSVVDRAVTATISKSDQIIFKASDVGLQHVMCSWNQGNLSVNKQKIEDFDNRFKFCFHTAQATLQFLQAENILISAFEIVIQSNLSVRNNFSAFVKLGLGSSAAVTVAVCKAILAFHGYDIYSTNGQEIIFKLSCIAHFIASGKTGSGFDIAASTYESTIVYRRFDPIFLENSIKTNTRFNELAKQPWPNLYIEKINLPSDLNVVVGFSGVSSSTTDMIKKINEFKSLNFVYYQNILNQINSVVLGLISAIKQNQRCKVLHLIRQNRLLLQQLSLQSGANLETPLLRKMIEQVESCGAAAKFSGAGGGDCVIALTFNKSVVHEIKKIWATYLISL